MTDKTDKTDVVERIERLIREMTSAGDIIGYGGRSLKAEIASIVESELTRLRAEVARLEAEKAEAVKDAGVCRTALTDVKLRLHYDGIPSEPVWKPNDKWIPDWRYEIDVIENALHGSVRRFPSRKDVPGQKRIADAMRGDREDG